MVEEGIASISIRREKWRGSLLLRFSSSLFIYLFNGEYGGGDREFLFYMSENVEFFFRRLHIFSNYLIVYNENINITKYCRLLQENKDHPEILNINCVDPLDRSALIAAIENENIELIKLLLELGIQVKVRRR